MYYKDDQGRTKFEVKQQPSQHLYTTSSSSLTIPSFQVAKIPAIFLAQEAALYVREGELNDKFYSHPTGQWSKLAYQILHHPVFHVFDLMLSILLMLLAIIEKPSVLGAKPTEQPLVTVGQGYEKLSLNNNRLFVLGRSHRRYYINLLLGLPSIALYRFIQRYADGTPVNTITPTSPV